MTPEESIDYWMRLTKLNMPESTVELWEAKLLFQGSQDLTLFSQNKSKILSKYETYSSEMKRKLARILVKTAYLKGKELEEEEKRIADRLKQDGFLFGETIENAMLKKIKIQNIFNNNTALGPIDSLDSGS